MAEHQVAVVAIKPDMGDGGDEPLESGESDYRKQLADAFDAAKDDDKKGWVALMSAALKACIAEYETSEEPKEEEDY